MFAKLRSEPKTRPVIAAHGASVRFARVNPGDAGARARVVSFGEQPLAPDTKSLRSALKALNVGRVSNGIALLAPNEYQFTVVDRSDVPAEELRSAMKWKLKDYAGVAPEEFSFDLLAIPGADGLTENARSVYAVIASNETLRQRIRSLGEANFGLSVIDVPETAQRNLATLYEQPDRGTAFFFFDDSGGLLTISFRGELYHTRRLDLKYSDVAVSAGEARSELFDRVVLELQRTLDNFERQFSFITLNRILVGPEPEETGLVAHLRANLSISVEQATLEQVLEFPFNAEPDAREQWRFFHLFGSALRDAARGP